MTGWAKPRTFFALVFYLTFVYLIINQLPVPKELTAIVSGLMGFFYGQKTKTGGK